MKQKLKAFGEFGPVVSIVLGYSLFVLYVFQFGFFQMVGLHYLGFLGPFDVFFNVPIILPYIVILSLLVFVILLFFWIVESANFRVAHKLVRFRVVILAIALVAWVGLLCYVRYVSDMSIGVSFLFGVSYTLFFFLTNLTIASAQYYVDRIFSLTAFSVLIFSFMGAYAFGLYIGFYRSELQTQKATITYQHGNAVTKLDDVRIIRSSGSGVVFSKDGKVQFINLSKVILLESN